MIYVRRSDDLTCLPLKSQTVTRLRALGVHTIGEMFDDSHGIKDARRWCNRIIREDGEYGLVDWGIALPARSGKLYWSLNTQGELAIYGKGKMMNYNLENRPPWETFREEIQAVLVEENVMTVGAGAFAGYPHVKTVRLCEKVERIAQNAFQNCEALEEIHSPRQLTHWREDAFSSGGTCPLYVGEKALAGTPFGRKLYGNMYISHDILMEYFGNDRVVKVPDGVTEIAPRVFENTPVESVLLPNSLKRIGVCAFQRTHLKELTLPSNLLEVADWAFHDNRELEQVTLLGSRVKIADTAFAHTPVEPYAHKVGKYWPSRLHIKEVAEPGMEPFSRLVVERNPEIPFGTKRLNVKRAVREMLSNGKILLRYMPDWGRIDALCVITDWTVWDWNTSGLCQLQRKDRPRWYAVEDAGQMDYEVEKDFLKKLEDVE